MAGRGLLIGAVILAGLLSVRWAGTALHAGTREQRAALEEREGRPLSQQEILRRTDEARQSAALSIIGWLGVVILTTGGVLCQVLNARFDQLHAILRHLPADPRLDSNKTGAARDIRAVGRNAP